MEPSLLALSRDDLIICCEQLLSMVTPGPHDQLLDVLLRKADNEVKTQPFHAGGGKLAFATCHPDLRSIANPTL